MTHFFKPLDLKLLVMVTNKTKASIKAGIVVGFFSGIIGFSLQIVSAVPALEAIAFLSSFWWAISIFLGLITGALSMFWGHGYVRTLTNSVVQGGVAGAVNGVLTMLFIIAGVVAAAVITGGSPVEGVTTWITEAQTSLISDVMMTVIYGMVGAVACAPFLLRLR